MKSNKTQHQQHLNHHEEIGRGPLYFTVKIKDESKNFSKISVFAIEKSLQMVTTQIEKTSRTRNGELLVLTKNAIGSTALAKTTFLVGIAEVTIKEHPTLNSSKGSIYSNDLIDETTEDITANLANQGVIESRRIMKRINKELVPTASLILTFKTSCLPTEIKAGFLNLKVRQYIPNPLRCTGCQKYGHSKKRCNNAPVCGRCAKIPSHEICDADSCVNCRESHPSFSRDCVMYKREAEIVKIQTIDRVSYNEARKKYKNMTPTIVLSESFRDVLKNTKTQLKQITNSTTTVLSEKRIPTPTVPQTTSSNIQQTITNSTTTVPSEIQTPTPSTLQPTPSNTQQVLITNKQLITETINNNKHSKLGDNTLPPAQQIFTKAQTNTTTTNQIHKQTTQTENIDITVYSSDTDETITMSNNSRPLLNDVEMAILKSSQ